MNLINVDQRQRQDYLDKHDTVWAYWGRITTAVILTILLEVLVGML